MKRIFRRSFLLWKASSKQNRESMSNKKIPKELQPWNDAKKRHRLSQMHIQMSRELGMNPKNFGKLDNHKQETWRSHSKKHESILA